MRFFLKAFWLLGIGISSSSYTHAQQNDQNYIVNDEVKNSFALAEKGRLATIIVGGGEDKGVRRAADHLINDLTLVTGQVAKLTLSDQKLQSKLLVLVGTLGNNPMIEELIKSKKIDISKIQGRWEASLTQVVDSPMPGVDKALVIVGSDRRGTIFGIYDLSSQIGVSPWYWWADVPVKKQKSVYVLPGVFKREPAVKYRGIFINDEAPALSSWAKHTFGGFNAKFYEKVFELILRSKGNYFWPAMWGSSFYVDDMNNPGLAHEMGVVIGTSHHEPLTRAHAEWSKFGGKAWDYGSNQKQLHNFWSTAMEERANYESVITLGMRGDGDEPMSEESNVELLEKIIADQRKIIQDKTKKAITETPQVWALYKEVQDYYDRGMRVPDDVILLLCDDNWGNIRRLPSEKERMRKGGYGIYYHFDYVGGPRNYKWINTNPIAKVWEQMNIAYKYGADQLWIVNVGDIKPMEFPTSFFLDMAWDPNRFTRENISTYSANWAKRQFGAAQADKIGKLIDEYSKFNGRVKPELLNALTYSLGSYREFELVVKDYQQLLSDAKKTGSLLIEEDQDAFYQLVLHPIEAGNNLYNMYFQVAKNKYFANQGRAQTNIVAEKVKELFAKDAEITKYYNEKLSGGKWKHMMDQVHIGYTSWQEPKENAIPALEYIKNTEQASLGVAIEASERWWPNASAEPILPTLSVFGAKKTYLEVFNRGSKPLAYQVSCLVPYISLSKKSGTVSAQDSIWINVDWGKAPSGDLKVPIQVNSPVGQVTVYAKIFNPDQGFTTNLKNRFVEMNGSISIEAAKFSRSVSKKGFRWSALPGYGKTHSAISVFPVEGASTLVDQGPYVEYDIYVFTAGEARIDTYVAPTLDISGGKGLKLGVSVNGSHPKILNLDDPKFGDWSAGVSKNIKVLSSKHSFDSPGKHTIRLSRIDPAVVIQKIVVDFGGVKKSYLGPPERDAFGK